MRSLGTACLISLVMVSANLTFGCSDEVRMGGKDNEAGSGAEGFEEGGTAGGGSSGGAGKSTRGSEAGVGATSSSGADAAAGAEATSSGGSGAAAGVGATSPGGSGAAAGVGATSPGGSGPADAGTNAPAKEVLCKPGLYYHCDGEDGCYGQQLCLDSGTQVGACVCFAQDQRVSGAQSTAGPEVPFLVPHNDRFPGGFCPTRPDLAEGTVCELEASCVYGVCSYFCQCDETGWSCGVLLC